jgi:hypothetical protein
MTTFNTWRISTRSGSQANCVEIGKAQGAVGVRDSKNRRGGTIELSDVGWTTFLGAVKRGMFDIRD